MIESTMLYYLYSEFTKNKGSFLNGFFPFVLQIIKKNSWEKFTPNIINKELKSEYKIDISTYMCQEILDEMVVQNIIINETFDGRITYGMYNSIDNKDFEKKQEEFNKALQIICESLKNMSTEPFQ